MNCSVLFLWLPLQVTDSSWSKSLDCVEKFAGVKRIFTASRIDSGTLKGTESVWKSTRKHPKYPKNVYHWSFVFQTLNCSPHPHTHHSGTAGALVLQLPASKSMMIRCSRTTTRVLDLPTRWHCPFVCGNEFLGRITAWTVWYIYEKSLQLQTQHVGTFKSFETFRCSLYMVEACLNFEAPVEHGSAELEWVTNWRLHGDMQMMWPLTLTFEIWSKCLLLCIAFWFRLDSCLGLSDHKCLGMASEEDMASVAFGSRLFRFFFFFPALPY